VGCGTGISSRQLASHGFVVVGVEPNEDMLAEARRAGGEYREGEASATGLASASVDLVTAAQAFHWFDVPASLLEFARILRAGGRCAAFWNLRSEGELMDAYDALLRAHAADYAVLRRPKETLAKLKARPEVHDVREAEFETAQRLDRAGFFGRAYSSSYVVHGLSDKEGFDRALVALFDAHAANDEIVLSYRCVAMSWRITPPRGSGVRAPATG
jgi:SAM-dependent methyltransferase